MFTLFVLSLGCHYTAARLLHSLPDDTYAFPKFKTVFYNDLPLLNNTAQQWLRDGLKGGVDEFLDLPWQAPQQASIDASQSDQRHASNHSLEHMRMGPSKSYLCLIPSQIETTPIIEEPEIEPSPAQSWSLLQPLADKCLYLRNSWFTYSYCHNQEVRQFHELPPTTPSNVYKPQEDTNEDSYSLGRAPKTEIGSELSIAQASANNALNLELARGAGSRYLVQRWGDGTICDKTGEPREIEIQFHCSMTQSDTILFVREAKTCSYVLVINTPRLCGEPGFRSPLDSRDEAPIRCREVVDTLPADSHPPANTLQESDFPPHAAPPRKQLPAETAPRAGDKPGYNDLIKQALEKIMGKSKINKDQQMVFEVQGKNGEGEEMIVEFVDGDSLGSADSLEWSAESKDTNDLGHSLVEQLRAAGFDVKGEKGTDEWYEWDDDDHKQNKKTKKKTKGAGGDEL